MPPDIAQPQAMASTGARAAAGSEVPASQASDQEERIRRAAYAAAERRGFAPGYELDDWLEAERQVLGAGAPAQPDQAAPPGARTEGSS